MIDAVTDEIWMIEPPFGMFATNRWKNWKGPVNWTAAIRSRSSRVVSSNGASRPHPVALTPTSMCPNRFRARSTSASRSASDVMSHGCHCAPIPSATSASASGRRPATSTVAPSSAYRRAMACPTLPGATPSTIAVFPLSFVIPARTQLPKKLRAYMLRSPIAPL